MKRHSGLYPQIYDFANLLKAYQLARRNKRYQSEVLRFTKNKEENLINIQNHLIWHSYKQGSYRHFTVTEPKTRLISALPFKDRIVQHAINLIIEPIFDKRFYAHSYACRKGRGMHSASTTLSRWIRHLSFEGKTVYALKCDIHHYFGSIDHTCLKTAIRTVIKDHELLWLLDLIIDSNPNGRGIPVGNLTSQLFANFYLDALDKYIKEELHARYYIRYMDDFIILSHSKTELRRAMEDIRIFLFDRLLLTFNPKTTIVSEKNGIDFCGYRHWADHKKVRKSSVRRMHKRIKAYSKGKITKAELRSATTSWLGHVKHADTYFLRQSIKRSYVQAITARKEKAENIRK